MDTTYFSIDAKRILVHRAGQAQKAAAGGTVSTCYMVIPRRKRPRPAQSGVVLDFEACRRALAGEKHAVLPEEHAVRQPRAPRPFQLSMLLDWAATAAVIGMAVAAISLFLRL